MVHVDYSRIDSSVVDRQKIAWSAPNHDARTVEIHSFDHCWMAARGLVFDQDKHLVEQSVGVHHEVDAATKLVRELEHPHVDLTGEHVLLKRPGATCYGHWLVEILPNLGIYQSAEGKRAKAIVQKLEGRMREVQYETLGLLGIAPDSIVETRTAVYRVEKLHAVFGATETLKSMSPLIRETFEKIGRNAGPGPHKKIYLERNPEGTRSIANSLEVRDRLEAMGFYVVRPENLSFTQQVSLMQGAEIVIGVTGSALTNAVFCKRGTKVLALAPSPILDSFYWNLCSLCELQFTELRFPVNVSGTQRLVYDEPMHVDLPTLEAAINDL